MRTLVDRVCRTFGFLTSPKSRCPKMNGYEFIEKVRQLPQGKDLPAIALSGLSREQDIAQCFKAGFSAHFNKPIALDKLTFTIINLLQPESLPDDSG